MSVDLITIQNSLTSGSIDFNINKYSSLYDHSGSDIQISLLLGVLDEGTSVFKKCKLVGQPRSQTYDDPFTAYDFQTMFVTKMFDMSLEINAENLMILSGKIPAGNISSPVVYCFFENSSNFTYSRADSKDDEDKPGSLCG